MRPEAAPTAPPSTVSSTAPWIRPAAMPWQPKVYQTQSAAVAVAATIRIPVTIFSDMRGDAGAVTRREGAEASEGRPEWRRPSLIEYRANDATRRTSVRAVRERVSEEVDQIDRVRGAGDEAGGVGV